MPNDANNFRNLFAKGNQAFFSGNLSDSITYYVESALTLQGLYTQFEGNLSLARRAYRRQQSGQPLKLAVCGWSLAHNPAGRVMVLLDAYRPCVASGQLQSLEVIGALFSRWGEGLWGPMSDLDLPCHLLRVEDDQDFLVQALRFVAEHPYDIVHLSKPRFPNLVFGLLYRLVWDAQVIWDIDDEELAFANEGSPLSLSAALAQRPELTISEALDKPFWTQLCVGEINRFPVASVSNPALQARYGGALIAHVRDEHHFRPSLAQRQAARRQFNIPMDAKVVLFMGTPREHKGLLETAQGLATLQRDDLIFVIAGNFSKSKAGSALKKALQGITNIEIVFLPDQPFKNIPDIVALGDYCVLLQSTESLVGQFQLPAKLVDALAMGLIIFARVSAATQWLVDLGTITPVTTASFPFALKTQLKSQDEQAQKKHNREVFEKHLSIRSVQPIIQQLLAPTPCKSRPPRWEGRLEGLLNGDLRTLLCNN